MKSILRIKSLFFVAAISLLLIAGCGGGGGGGNGGDDTGGTYTGKTTPATITKSNAEEILQDALNGGVSGAGFSAAFSAIEASGQQAGSPMVYRIISRTADTVAGIAAERSSGSVPASASAIITEPINETGECGGSVTGTMQVNNVTGDVSGTLVFNDLCEMGSYSSGTITITGNGDWASDDMDITMNFDDFSVVSDADDVDATMNGSVRLITDGSTDTMTMNIYLKDNGTGDYYWMEDYVLEMYYGDYADTMEVSGRFYSPEYGYVTLTTTTAFVVDFDDYYPSEGVLIAAGAGNTRAKLTVLSSTSYMVEADENGDGTYEWDSGELYWDE